MAITRGRAVLAAVAPLLLLSANAADAACVEEVCVNAPVDVTGYADVTSLGQLRVAVDPTRSGGGGEGVVCVYTKHHAPPPPGWSGDPDSQPPYVWQQSQAWGFRYPYGYDTQICAPACVIAPTTTTHLATPCTSRVG